MIEWNVYEITSEEKSIHGIMFRGRIRKFGIENNKNILVENASDKENCVRFAVPIDEEIGSIKEFIISLVKDSNIILVLENIKNPVLSKIKVNNEIRYTI